MPETYTVQPGQDIAGNLPPVNLPTFGQPQRLRIDVRPQVKPSADPYAAAGFQEYATPSEEPKAIQGDPYAAAGFQEYSGTPEIAAPVSAGEAATKGALSGFSFGLTPALEGLSEVAGPNPPEFEQAGYGDPTRPIAGAFKMMHNAFSNHPDPKVKEAYERGRDAALKKEQAAQKQQPMAFMAGQMAGSLMTPGFGAAKAGTAGARLARGAGAGAIGGGLYGAGTGISEGKSVPEVAEKAAVGAAIGAPLGGALGAAIGPRVVNPVSAGQRAAATAAGLGAPLPRGVASDNRAVQATTAKLRELPFGGEAIGRRVEETQHAAGQRIGDIAGGMAGGAPSRPVADLFIRRGFDSIIDANTQAIDAGYNALRGQINQNQHFTMPQTNATLNRIMARRAEAHEPNPAEGLEQFRSLASGATFNGAHRARAAARPADITKRHTGYEKGDYKELTAAMTQDLRAIVQSAATNQTPQGRRAALNAFDQAERQFGPRAEFTKELESLRDAGGETAISTVLSAANPRAGGNLRLLAQLRNSMPPQEFQQIGATLLAELGHNKATNEFSLAQFASALDPVKGQVSDRALNVLFSPQHVANIREIAGMGQHIKGALQATTRGQSGGLIVLLDVAKDALLIGTDVASGGLGLGTAIGGVSTGALYLAARWLASPATAASMSAWTRAYRGIAGGAASAARIATFNMATRNLANNLGIPVERILNAAAASQ